MSKKRISKPMTNYTRQHATHQPRTIIVILIRQTKQSGRMSWTTTCYLQATAYHKWRSTEKYSKATARGVCTCWDWVELYKGGSVKAIRRACRRAAPRRCPAAPAASGGWRRGSTRCRGRSTAPSEGGRWRTLTAHTHTRAGTDSTERDLGAVWFPC